MLASTLLVKKRKGLPLEDDEIRFLIDGFCTGKVTDYQMSALAMAICLRGMNPREITTLTRAMLDSGDTLPRPSGEVGQSNRPRVDKHSTGGLGDKVSLILAPLLAACDVDVPMISGRGLGISGGTLDKLESIDGFRTQLTVEQSSAVLRDVGAFIVGASDRIAPADRKLYALRDVTGTVESVPLITASIVSKKLAANLDALVMDIKTGGGAFMKTSDDAIELAQSIIRVGCESGLPTTAILSDMDQPLGRAVGNAIEVNEAIDVLRGNSRIGQRGGEVLAITIELCAELLVNIDWAGSLDQARDQLDRRIADGRAMERFERMVQAQGGQLKYPIPLARSHEIITEHSGYVAGYNCERIGESVVAMGGGRRQAGDAIDHGVGIETHHRIGDYVEKGHPIFTLHCRQRDAVEHIKSLQSAISISDSPVDARSLILMRLDQQSDDQRNSQH